MSWDDLEAAQASAEERQDDAKRALQASLRRALQDPVLSKFLVHLAVKSNFASGQADQTAYRGGQRDLAMSMLTLGGYFDG